ncbi:MAG TPA: nucleotidyltransferase family protein [Candidatus Nanoarchaeia archaeon]|nr:nucleotidyltransferase family protein [Candidatus Nanoarchaeia archaeon]
MKVLILIAGFGTRLYPLTENISKAFIEVGGKKIIDHIMEKLDSCKDISDIFLITNNLFFEAFCEWDKQSSFTKKIRIINNLTNGPEERLGAVGDMAFVIERIGLEEDIIIIGGDTLFGFGVEESIAFFKGKNTSVVAGKAVEDKSLLATRFGVIEVGEGNKIVGFEDKPKIPKTNIGSLCYYILKKEDLSLVLQCVKEGNKDHSGDLIEFMFKRTLLHSFVFESEWFDVTNQDILRSAEKFYSK